MELLLFVTGGGTWGHHSKNVMNKYYSGHRSKTSRRCQISNIFQFKWRSDSSTFNTLLYKWRINATDMNDLSECRLLSRSSFCSVAAALIQLYTTNSNEQLLITDGWYFSERLSILSETDPRLLCCYWDFATTFSHNPTQFNFSSSIPTNYLLSGMPLKL
jgi:hypothetical protein